MRKKDNSVSLAPFIHTEKNAPKQARMRGTYNFFWKGSLTMATGSSLFCSKKQHTEAARARANIIQ